MTLKNKIKIYPRNKLIDKKGWFLKVIDGKEACLPNSTGEVYIICAKLGECRANHYHIRANEWFTLIQGKALMILEDVQNKERMEIELNSDIPKTVYVPNKISHAFKNLGEKELILVTYTDVLYDPKDTIEYILYC